MTTYTPVILITGCDAQGNEYIYWKSSENNIPEIPNMGKWDEWFEGYEEHFVSARFVANIIMSYVIKVRFGNEEMSRSDWQLCGCPFELSGEEMTALHKMNQSMLGPQEPPEFGSREWFEIQKEIPF